MSGAIGCGGLLPQASAAGTAGLAGVMAALLLISASIVHVRHFCLKFAIPLEGKARRVVVRKADGEALLEAMPRTGGWRVAE